MFWCLFSNSTVSSKSTWTLLFKSLQWMKTNNQSNNIKVLNDWRPLRMRPRLPISWKHVLIRCHCSSEKNRWKIQMFPSSENSEWSLILRMRWRRRGRSVQKNVWTALFISFGQETEQCFWWYSRWVQSWMEMDLWSVPDSQIRFYLCAVFYPPD